MNKIHILIFVFAILLNGCKRDIPEPEVIISISNEYDQVDLPVIAQENFADFDVRYHVEGDKVYIECIVPNISFRDNSKNQGKIILYVNGQKKDEVGSAAFIVKGLPKGEYNFRIDIVKIIDGSLHLSKEFLVNIT